MPDYVFVVRVCTYCHLGLCGFGSLWILVSLFDPPYWLRLGLCALYWMKGSLYMKLCQIETLVVSQCIECSLFEYLLLFIVSLKIHRWMLDKFNIWYSELLYLSSPKLLDDSDQKEKKIMCFCLLICYYKWMCRMPDHVWLLVCGKPIWKNQNFSILICPWQLLTTPPVISDSEIFILQTYCSVFWSYHPLHPILYILIECYIHE